MTDSQKPSHQTTVRYPGRIMGELSSESFAKAVSWWQQHAQHVERLVASGEGLDSPGAAYPPSGSDTIHPELWRAPHWRWLKELTSE